jgi:molybdenum-dependent DNA-binding transcriptional regulator ModE
MSSARLLVICGGAALAGLSPSAAPSSDPAPGGRLDRLLIIAGHPGILAAAQALGLWQATLYEQVARLERACGGPLVNRRPRPASTAILTPLGRLLCQQGRDYLDIRPGPGTP